MERKLLSLPNFFVLLLVAGIAFLAAPVVEVHAQAPTVQSIQGPTTAISSPFRVTVTVSEAVNVGPDGTADATTLTPQDFSLVLAPTTSGSSVGTPVAIAAGLPGAATAPAVAYSVPVTVPANFVGSATLSIAATAAFADSADNTAYVAPATAVPGAKVQVDLTVPTVAIALAQGVSGRQNGPFEITFTLSEAPATTGAGVFVADDAPVVAQGQTPATPTATTGDVTVTGGSITESARTAGTNIWRAIITPTPSTADATTDAVTVSVAAGAFTDAAGNSNTASTPSPFSVPIDNTAPTVTVAPAGGTDGITTTGTTHSAGMAETFKVRVTIEGGPLGSGDAAFDVDDDVTVTGGTVEGDATADASTLALDYIVTIAQDNIKTATPNVQIQVPANAIMDEAGNGNAASDNDATTEGSQPLIVAVTGGSDPMEEEQEAPDERGTTGAVLTGTGEVGFTFGDANTVIAKNGFVVLAKSPHGERNGNALPNDAGFTSALTTAIDIKDAAWQDLRHFLVTTEGGTIDLIGPAGTPVKSVVISEVMWGNDNGKTDPTSSQWIELYNTTGAPITLNNWKLQFSTKSPGLDMFTGNAAKASATALTGALTNTANPVVDKLSTWRDVGNYWLWEITDTAGGTYGQSGKSTRNSATSPGAPSELISMQRKINYDTVEKTDHVAGTEAAKRAENRNKQLEGVPGTAGGNWEASPEHGHLLTYRKGTPGAKPSIKRHDKTSVPRSSVVFNEIANRSDKKHDWIELHNRGSSDKKINGWELSVVTATGTDTELFTFTAGSNGDDIVVPAKGYLLIVNTDPRNTPLEGGYDVVNPGNSARQSDGAGNKPSRLYYLSDKLDIPKENFLLILRNGNDKTGTHEKIEDIAGNNPDFPSDADNTDVWPLRVWDLGATNDLGEKNDKTWVRDQGKDVFHGDAWKPDGGFTGVGIERQYEDSDSYTSGTPGYANNAVQNEVKSDGLTEATAVVISEIMFAIDSSGRVPQWIELHNPSHTQAVNLNKWRLEIVNYHGDTSLRVNDYATLVLPERRIQPNQTVLIVSRETSKVSGSANFPENRVIGIWNDTELKKAMGMDNSRDAVLSSMGFHLKLSDPKKKVVDEVGNIDANQHNADEPAWTLPGGFNDDGNRSSMVRAEDTENDGEERDSWRDADAVSSSKINPDANELYYGDSDDIGTPGYTPGGVLPVQLSSFYSKRNDAGAVIITWSTESELDNAGFNILRSLSRVGEFTRINAQLIPGAGTTGEKNTYTWTDTSARPNVVYYYQIEDVSLDGEHRTLRTTRLRGYVGAAGKATTIWGELKSRD